MTTPPILRVDHGDLDLAPDRATSERLTATHGEDMATSTTADATPVLLPERWVPAVRLGWLLLFALVLWLALVAQEQLRPSLDYLDGDFEGLVRSSVLRAGIDELGLSPWVMAWFLVGTSGLQLTLNYTFAVLLIWRRPREVTALVISVFLLVSSAPTYPLDLPDLRASDPLHGWIASLITYLFLCSFYLVVLIFPSGRFVPRWLALPAAAFVVFQAGAFFIDMRLQTMGSGVVDGLLLAGVLLSGVVGQVYRYRRVSGAIEREQTRVFSFGIGLALTTFVALNMFLNAANLDSPDYPAVQGLLISIGFEIVFKGLFMLASVSLVIAILRYRLFDLDVVINRTLVYLTLTTCVVGLYVAIVGGLGALLQTDRGGVSALLATGVIAVAFQPLRARLQRGVNRLLYGRRDEPYAVLTGLTRQLEATVAPTAVLPAIVESVATALRLPYVVIRLRRDHDGDDLGDIAAATGTPTPIALELPLLYQGAEIGTLQVAARSGDTSITPRDRALLDDLLGQIGVAVHAVRLTADLQRSRERIVTAREEELRRLRRDLHDGLGPRLAGMTLRIETVRDQLTHDPLAGDLLDDLSVRMEEAVSDIRRLVYGLRPPALDDLGMLGAMRQIASGYDTVGAGVVVSIDAPEQLPPLSAAAEVAAFRIVQEALTNVVRHAQAQQATITLAVDPAATRLTVTISDDGVGLDPNQRRGVGLQAMRERAEELGGTLTLTSPLADGRGTRVTATLPCQWADATLSTAAAPTEAGATA